MQKRTREIIALVLLGVLALIAMFAMGYYILVGHNWNVTASHIDDTIGQMRGYTVFLYEGTNPSPQAREAASDAQPLLDDESRGAATRDWSEPREPLTSEEVAESYREKGANVFVLDAARLSRYAEPIAVAKGGKKVGLFSVAKPFRKTLARIAVRDLARYNVDCTVALTDDPGLCDSGVRGITLVVCNDDEGESPDGEYTNTAYCVGVPYVGEVEAVIMAESGVLSSRTIVEL